MTGGDEKPARRYVDKATGRDITETMRGHLRREVAAEKELLAEGRRKFGPRWTSADLMKKDPP